MNKGFQLRNLAIFLIPIFIAGAIKFFVSPADITPFNADEAIVALMARHINQGNLPVFFYGQAYMGSLDAMLISIGFRIFGEEIWVIRFIQSLLYIGTVSTTMMIANRVLQSRQATLYAGLITAIPPVNFTLYTTVSLGGYGEMMLVGNLLLLSGFSVIEQVKDSEAGGDSKLYLGMILWGIGAGFGFWIIALTLVYSLPVIFLLSYHLLRKRSWKVFVSGLLFLAGFAIGSAPWWFYAIQAKEISILNELFGSALSGAAGGPIILRLLNRVLNLFVFGGTAILGLRPPWGIRWLMLPLIPFILILWTSVFIWGGKNVSKTKSSHGLRVLALMGLVLAIGFVFSPYGDDPSGRYFLPLIIPMAIFGANYLTTQFTKKPFLEYVALALILIFNFGGMVQAINENPPGLTTQFDKVAQVDQRYLEDLVLFLAENDVRTGYSNYWVSYPLAFMSGEEIIFLPRLPYHEDFRYTARDDRYYPYRTVVGDAKDLAYITTNHSQLDEYLRDQFSRKGIYWDENRIGDYQIFYNLSERIAVDELQLGVTTNP